MKRSYRLLFNLGSLALLAVALYLTFLRKETAEFPPAGAVAKEASGSVAKGAIPVAQPKSSDASQATATK